ncbi:unnamed protein product [Peronospora farinosa]|uniref:Uncharacterized protein n=1 Tax=Peronospora farinosa TaxID=134698 RepID=A0ABN8BSG5_9STRA|nr:unnamed protein product [Peronospora farinosa]
MEDVLSPVLHQHSDLAVPAVAKFHPPPHQQFDGAVSTFPHQQFDAAVSTFPHQQFDDATLNFDDHFFSWLQQFDDATSTVPHQPFDDATSTVPHQPFADTVSTIPHQPFADTVSTVPHQQFDDATFTNLHQPSDAAVSTLSHPPVFTFHELFLPLNQQFDAAVPTVDEFLKFHDDVNGQLKLIYPDGLASAMENRDAIWLEKNELPTEVFGLLDFLPKKELLLVQMATFRWLDYVDQYSTKNSLGSMPLLKALKEVGYDDEILIKPKTFQSLLANALMKVWGYTLEDFKTLNKQSDQESALSLALAQWIRTHENGNVNANVSGKKRKEREF